MNFEAF